MQKYCFILAALVLLFAVGCSPTIIHKHYHYYPDGIGQCDKQTSCAQMNDGNKTCGKRHGKMKHVGQQHGMKHAEMKHGCKKHGIKHGLQKQCEKQQPGMHHGGMKQMSHGQKGKGNKPMGGPDCPCDGMKGQTCNCPKKSEENLESLFSE